MNLSRLGVALVLVSAFTASLTASPAIASPREERVYSATTPSSPIWPSGVAAPESSFPGETPPTYTIMSWATFCLPKWGFCADFPGIGESYSHSRYDSATAKSGRLDAFTSDVFASADMTTFCVVSDDSRCPVFEQYFVEIIDSKYADPYKAITAINGGIDHPHFTRISSHLAAQFDRGIYGGPGFAVWAHNRVYYLETVSLTGPTRFSEQFLRSFRII